LLARRAMRSLLAVRTLFVAGSAPALTARGPVAGLFSALGEGVQSLLAPPRGQIQALDGLRAFAILLVIATHTGHQFASLGGASNTLLKMPFVQGGWIGVDLFFALSGFFIGRQLWKEFARDGTVNVPRFILRRGFRIWPLYYTVLLIGAAAAWTFGASDSRLWPEALLVSNYFEGRLVPGSWSLSSEEQFYLIVPTLVFLMSLLSRKLRPGRWMFYALFLLAPMIRFLVWKNAGAPHIPDAEWMVTKIYFPFHTHLDGLIIGMIYSNLASDPVAKGSRLLQSGWTMLGLAILAAAALKFSNHVLFEYTGLALVFGTLIWFCLRTRPNFATRALSWRGFYLVSRLSFGMYLLHQVPMKAATQWALVSFGFARPSLQFTAAFLGDVLLTMGMAAVGYVVIEHPFLKLRSRLGLSH
jgi:peptidoglycan/LPS O-acetylase OafA/YrhL